MDSIKKKMMAMKLEKENALEKAINLENQLKEKAKDFEKKEEEMNEWLSKVKNIQTEVDTVQESLQEAISKLEETEKRATNAEAEVAAMTRRIRLLEEDFEQSSGRLTETSTKLDDASKAAEESESARWRLNNQQGVDEMKISELERSIEAASVATQESTWKYEETMRRIVAARQTLATAEEKAQSIEVYAKILEDQLSAIAAKLKAKEIARDKTAELEEMYLKHLSVLRDQVREAKSRAEGAEAVSKRYEQEVQRVKDTLFSENKNFTLLRKEIDSALDEYHSI